MDKSRDRQRHRIRRTPWECVCIKTSNSWALNCHDCQSYGERRALIGLLYDARQTRERHDRFTGPGTGHRGAVTGKLPGVPASRQAAALPVSDAMEKINAASTARPARLRLPHDGKDWQVATNPFQPACASRRRFFLEPLPQRRGIPAFNSIAGWRESYVLSTGVFASP